VTTMATGTVTTRPIAPSTAAETGLDFFGARYFSGAQGRFTSPDTPFADQHPEDPQSWNLYAYVRNNPLAHVDTDGQACFALNSGSAFCGRATEYGQIDARVSGQTRFFAAASAVSQSLANSDVGYGGFMSRTFAPISGSTQQFLGAVGQDLLQMNRSAAGDIQSGRLTGPDLDAGMVHMEQSKVQGSLDSLKKSDPAAYQTLVKESNAGLNPSDAMRKAGSLFATDKAYLGVVDGVRKKLGRDIDVSKQGDREAIGNSLI
jgi:RHS repeat-associated protein